MTERETYLGGGHYAAFDGWQMTLRAARIGGDHFGAPSPCSSALPPRSA
jgi:hypothetical protein